MLGNPVGHSEIAESISQHPASAPEITDALGHKAVAADVKQIAAVANDAGIISVTVHGVLQCVAMYQL
jgi:hypothetical protein